MWQTSVSASVLSSVARLFGALVLSLKIVRIGHHHHQLECEGAEEESGDGGCVLLLRASRIRERGAEGGGQGSKGWWWWCTYILYTTDYPKLLAGQRYQMLRLKLTRKTVGTTQVRFLLLFLLLLWTESVFCVPLGVWKKELTLIFDLKKMPVNYIIYLWIINSFPFLCSKIVFLISYITYLGSFQFWPAMKVWNLGSSEHSKNIAKF